MDGTLNVIRQAYEKGVKKFVVTSSWVTLNNRGLETSYEIWSAVGSCALPDTAELSDSFKGITFSEKSD